MKRIAAPLLLFIACHSLAQDLMPCGDYECPAGGIASNIVVERDIYVLSANRTTKFADWAAYHVTEESIGTTRDRHWKSDPELPSDYTLEPEDYKGAYDTLGTDRGHLVPLASFTSHPDWEDTNYLSNITPQDKDLNRGPWLKLENAVRKYVNRHGDLHIVTGPIYYRGESMTLPGADEPHVVPGAYFKVIADLTQNGVSIAAFVMPQDAGRSDEYCEYTASIDDIEYMTRLDIFPALNGHIDSLLDEFGCN
tara:strand:+ start:1348 stop:2103 length:756 start_codon:yes stop_codon:yes gene_type:complete